MVVVLEEGNGEWVVVNKLTELILLTKFMKALSGSTLLISSTLSTGIQNYTQLFLCAIEITCAFELT